MHLSTALKKSLKKNSKKSTKEKTLQKLPRAKLPKTAFANIFVMKVTIKKIYKKKS